MMNKVLPERNVYENFEVETDILFFKVGVQQLVSFHGRNYNIKKRMSSEDLKQLTANKNFFPISSRCFINIGKIKSIASGTVYFGAEISDAKRVTVTRRKQSIIEQLCSK